MAIIEKIADKDLTQEERKACDDKKRNHNFLQVYKYNMKPFRELIGKNPTAAEIYWFLAEYMNNGNAVSCSSKVLEEVTGKSRMTIYRAIKELKERGFLTVIKSGSSNVYVMNPNVVWSSWNNNKKYCEFKGPILVARSENREVEESIKKMKVNSLANK